MRIISSDALAALDSGRFKVRALVKLMPSSHEPLCFWDDLGLIQIDDDVYSGAAGRFTLESAASVADMSTQTVNINFSALDPDIVSMVEGVSWSQQPALIQRVIIALDAPQVLHVSEEFAGFMDQLFWEEGVGSTATLKLQCVGASREYSRAGGSTSSDADQRKRDPLDDFFASAASAITQTIDWGRNPQPPPAQKKSFLARLFG